VVIDGLTAGLIDLTYDFTANVAPITSTQPITFEWWATDLGSSMNMVNSVSDVASYMWTTPGVKTVMVTATNESGTSVMASHVITIDLGISVWIGPSDLLATPYAIGVHYLVITGTAATDAFTVTAGANSEAGWLTELPGTISIGTGLTATVPITIVTPNNVGFVTDTVGITITSQSGSASTVLQTTTAGENGVFCRFDFDRSAVVNIGNILTVVNLFNKANRLYDYDHSGVVNIGNILSVVNSFNKSCP
jgi:hypothetical protein